METSVPLRSLGPPDDVIRPADGSSFVPWGTASDPKSASSPGRQHQPHGAARHDDQQQHARRPAADRDWDQAVVTLYDQQYAGLCRLASVLLGDAAAAEEVVQEAFMRTFAGWRRIRDTDRASWYVRAAVVNLCRSRVRRRTTEGRGNQAAALDSTHWHGHLVTSEGGESGQDDANERTPEVMAVLNAVRSLPRRQREAVVLRYYADLSEADIAATLRCATGTVKSQLSKARATLGRLLADTAPDTTGTIGGHHPAAIIDGRDPEPRHPEPRHPDPREPDA